MSRICGRRRLVVLYLPVMNYRHAYHAGNFADVVKHAALALLLRRLQQKETPLCVLDLFAGIGAYDLAGEEAAKTGEAAEGIGRLWPPPPKAPGELAPYLEALAAMNGGASAGALPRHYPGSPELARRLLRPQDRLVLAELHPEDSGTLRRRYGRDGQVAVHRRDGYEALPALVPPAERRGLVLVDPPYERPDEPERLVRALARAYRRWPTGLYLVWYPIKDAGPLAAFKAAAREAVPRRLLAAELTLFDEMPAWRLNGCGLLLVNPPWQSAEALATLLGWLQPLLSRGGGRAAVRWLAPEEGSREEGSREEG